MQKKGMQSVVREKLVRHCDGNVSFYVALYIVVDMELWEMFES